MNTMYPGKKQRREACGGVVVEQLQATGVALACLLAANAYRYFLIIITGTRCIMTRGGGLKQNLKPLLHVVRIYCHFLVLKINGFRGPGCGRRGAGSKRIHPCMDMLCCLCVLVLQRQLCR
jgi:hypothetical protein